MVTAPPRRRVAPPALAVGLLLATLPQACAPAPVRRNNDEGPVVADEVSVSPELQRAPQREPEPMRVTRREEPPPQPAQRQPPASQGAGQEEPTATRVPADEWWRREPAPVEGRIRLVASATGQTLRQARRAAVDQGLAELRRVVGDEPTGVRYELANVQRDEPGLFRGYVLVSCDAPGHTP